MFVPTIGTSRCGEIFVTNNADKWIFVCAHCQKATNDIGVFICHIKIYHLNSRQGLPTPPIPVPNTPISVPLTSIPVPMVSIPVPNTSIPVPLTSIPSPMTSIQEGKQIEGGNVILKGEHSSKSGIFTKVSKIVDISLLTDINETKTTLTSYPPQETFTQKTCSHSGQENKEDVTETFGEAQQETIYVEDDEGTNDSDNGSVYSPNVDNSDESNDSETNDDIKASGSQRKINNLKHTCDICNKSFEYKRSLDIHINKRHKRKLDKKLYKCKKCRKTFRSASGLQNHLKTHNKKNYLKCPICQFEISSTSFHYHVMTHESDTCFPCQICGKMHTSKEERMEHIKTHEESLPFPCDICHRRFRKQYYLKIHMKSHFQYQCKFCPNHYNAVEVQKQPYVCHNCENIQEVKERIQLQRILEKNRHVFESDEDSIISSNCENMDFTRNDSNANKDNIAIESENNDSNIKLSNSLNNNEVNGHDVLNKDDSDLEFVDEVNDEIGASSSATKTSPMEDDKSQQKCNYCNKFVKSQHVGSFIYILYYHMTKTIIVAYPSNVVTAVEV